MKSLPTAERFVYYPGRVWDDANSTTGGRRDVGWAEQA